MITTGGENVYGPEVERVIMAHPAISDAAVIGVPDDRWGESVMAVVVRTTSIDTDDVVEFCRRNLASYKCPECSNSCHHYPEMQAARFSKLLSGKHIGVTENAPSDQRPSTGPTLRTMRHHTARNRCVATCPRASAVTADRALWAALQLPTPAQTDMARRNTR
jgi:acyl-CoA synthetase (AMP-forming)/AMP-acid ligase II